MTQGQSVNLIWTMEHTIDKIGVDMMVWMYIMCALSMHKDSPKEPNNKGDNKKSIDY